MSEKQDLPDLVDILGSPDTVTVSRDFYDPVAETVKYAAKAIRLEKERDSIISKARNALLKENAVGLYMDFFQDTVRRIINPSEKDVSKLPALARSLEDVAHTGLGMSARHITVRHPTKGGGARYHVDPDFGAIKEWLQESIAGETFLREYRATDPRGRGGASELLVGGSDVSQHRGTVPVPGHAFRWTAPIVLNNAAGAIVKIGDASPDFKNLFDPRPNEQLLQWMLVDPSYMDDLSPAEYNACLATAMDVGHYKFDFQYLLNDTTVIPDVIFRDGRIHPQDVKLDNYVREDRWGNFFREAINGLFACLNCAKNLNTVYCGVAKSVRMKAFSAVLDWFIADRIDKKWSTIEYNLNDGMAMTALLSHPSFRMDENFAIGTCLIRRTFYARAGLNREVPDKTHAEEYFKNWEKRLQEQMAKKNRKDMVNLDRFRKLCGVGEDEDIGRLYMFYLGHSKSPQQRLPRYEFFHHDRMENPAKVADYIFSALRFGGLDIDTDHSYMSREDIEYLVPAAKLHAHYLSKNVGKLIDQQTRAEIMKRFMHAVSA